MPEKEIPACYLHYEPFKIFKNKEDSTRCKENCNSRNPRLCCEEIDEIKCKYKNCPCEKYRGPYRGMTRAEEVSRRFQDWD